ncbi:acyl-CoA desaturase [Micromonospora sp. NPDC000207]|uniref:acyl-CoA desaturase n=1 Tax=Micromonospora sp. NPDC000207 TaxID=3154246 RepID=UPI00332FD195
MPTVVVEPSAGGPTAITEGTRPRSSLIILWVFVTTPFVALLAAVPVAWGGWLGWPDLIIALVWYVVTGLGVTVGFHRHFTHASFKAGRWLRVALAVAGSLAIQGQIIQWVADHRRHHAFSDLDGDPHSPWRFGASAGGLARGLLHAHVGWFFGRELSNRRRFAPDLLADRDISRVDRLFPVLVAVSLLGPALTGALVTWSWQGALTAFFWAGLVRVGLLHHVTWAINSVCHVYGERPFALRQGDRAANFWPLAILSFGESWHNLHHADPTCARHGVLRGQFDISARVIWLFERVGVARDVRWPKPERIAARRARTGPESIASRQG